MPSFFTALTDRHDRYLSLLVSLVALIIAYPIVSELELLHLYGLLMAAQLIVAVYSIGNTKRHLWTAIGLCLPGIVLHVVSFAQPSRISILLADTAVTIFLGYVIVVVYRAVLTERDFDQNTVAGAISVYLLLGVLGSGLYAVAFVLQPESFTHVDVADLDGGLRQGTTGRFLYFSFVTLTTLGYGDILPETPIAETLAWTEAVVGQVFLAVTIASLVGMRVAQHHDKEKKRRGVDDR